MEIFGQKKKVENLIENGYEFRFEQYLSQGWETFQKSPLQLILYTLILVGISFVINLIPKVGEVASLFISPVLAAGFYVGIKKLDETGTLEIADFFKAFDHWLQLFLFSLVSSLLISLGFILLFFPGLWLAIGISLGMPLVLFAKLEFWDAIKSSVKLVSKKWFQFFGLVIVLILINFVGALLLGIGLFITVPFTFATMYAAYKDIVGFDGNSERDVTDHLVGDKF